MTLRVCPVPDCPTLTLGGRCAKHERQKREQRGTTTQQGLGWQHQQRRAQLVTVAMGTSCPDCGTPMTDPRRMVADHSTPRSVDRSSVADRVHCRKCSDKQGGRVHYSQ